MLITSSNGMRRRSASRRRCLHAVCKSFLACAVVLMACKFVLKEFTSVSGMDRQVGSERGSVIRNRSVDMRSRTSGIRNQAEEI